MHTIKESDWKLLRRLHTVALERYCQQVLAESERLHRAPDKSFHERYLAVFDLLRKRDKELARLFDDLRRSTALQHLAGLCGLLTAEEVAQFSEETQMLVAVWLGEAPS